MWENLVAKQYLESKKKQFASSSTRPSCWRVVYEQGVNIEDNEKESSDRGDNGFEATIPASKGTFEPHNSYFGGQK